MPEPGKSALKPPIGRPGLPPLPDTAGVRAAREAVARLHAAGHEAYFVGGFVRDWLLGIDHSDVDVATSATPEHVEAIFEKTKRVGAHFGVMLAAIGGIDVEIATFRSDGSYVDFRRPTDVKYGTLEEDAQRRDFTINALYYDPASGAIKDFHAGMLDLRRRILRTVGPAIKRFGEDALRLMRAVRFAVRYELEIEALTGKALRMKAPLLAEISKERIGDELARILTGPHPERGMRLMTEYGLWAYVIPEVDELRGVEQGREAHPEGDVYEHTAGVLANLPADPPLALALGALLHDIAKPRTRTESEKGLHFYGHQKVGAEMAREICGRLRYSAELTERVADLVENHMQFLAVRGMKESTRKRFLGGANFELQLQLHRADALGSHGDLDAYEYCAEERQRLSEEHGDELRPKTLATGEDLIALGMKPGPAFGELLDELFDEQLEGRIRTREAALEFLKARAEGAR